MTEPTATTPLVATPFSLRLHFEGAFVFSVETDGTHTPETTVTGVKVYAPTCDHLHALTINSGNSYMLENYWHCINAVYAAAPPATALTLSQLQANVSGNTPMVKTNRPIGSGWSVAFTLPAPNDWQCSQTVPTTDPTTNLPCFSGTAAKSIPSQIATEQTLIYTPLTDMQLDGLCFECEFPPVDGFLDLYITSEMPTVIPTVPHQSRAVGALASLLGIDLVFQFPLPPGTDSSSGPIRPKTVHVGGCSVGIVTSPKP